MWERANAFVQSGTLGSVLARATAEKRKLFVLSFRLVSMSQLVPPPHLLRALIATSRHGSVVRAAEELHLTASAVSKQLMELERQFGLTLFERVHKRLRLTAGGRRYVERVAPLLDEIERVTLDLLAERPDDSPDQQILRLSMIPTFGAKWLIPRLPAFLEKHPEIDLGFVPFVKGDDFSRPEQDCAIRYGHGVWPGARADYLVGREVVMIAWPDAAARLQTPRDVEKFALLHHADETDAWARWCAHHRIGGVRARAGRRVDQVSSLVQAVIAGLGIALVPRCLVEDEINSGAVVEAPFPVPLQAAGYHFCYPDAKALLPALQAFRVWLVTQVS
jgi:LysR family glycine cleavage system transcriptional activator